MNLPTPILPRITLQNNILIHYGKKTNILFCQGKVGNDVGNECEDCPAGTKRSDTDDDCVPCDPGMISAGGASDCTECPKVCFYFILKRFL